MADTPALYRENIQELLNAWGGNPPPALPYNSQQDAQHAGVVQLRCFINNVCPFTKSPYEDNGFFFSPRTLDKISKELRDGSGLTYTDGLDGLYFIPKYVYRNNYIFEPDFAAMSGEGLTTEIIQGDWFNYHKEVEDPHLVEGARETRYLSEQAWAVQPSVFDGRTGLTEGSPECVEKTKWKYESKNLTESQATDTDIAYDYKQGYYNRNVSGPAVTVDKTSSLKYKIQVPVQTSVYNDATNEPVHWRLMKKTPLYQGEDFFIRFFKEAKKTTVNTTGTNRVSFLDPNYDLLDFTSTSNVDVDGVRIPINRAVEGEQIIEGEEFSSAPKWDLYNQAYYVIELGYGARGENYFILLTERNYPVFIMRDPHWGFSRVLSSFEELEGEDLFKVNSFTMTVRNHLKLVSCWK
jgi:hypothetical protein